MRNSTICANILLLLTLLLVWGCDVHEWPHPSDTVPIHLRLDCQTDMAKWHHTYADGVVSEVGVQDPQPSERTEGELRYIVRAFDAAKGRTANRKAVAEFIFTKRLEEGYRHEQTISLPPGNYDIAVWADMRQSDQSNTYYNITNFASISLDGDYRACDDYRDAFGGSAPLTLVADIYDREPDTLDMVLVRPLAKFEFVTTDIVEFAEKQLKKSGATRTVDVGDYEVRFYYVGYIPISYNHFTDSPANADTGVLFSSSLEMLSEGEASLGFDYLFTYNYGTKIAVQVGLYDKQGEQLSLTEVIDVPLRRSHHTVMQGEFLLSEADGGVKVDPDFEGDHNVVIP